MKTKIVWLYCGIMLFLLNGCWGKLFDENNLFAPKPFKMGMRTEDAPEEYKSGWDDGCTTGLSTMVPGYYKSFYQYKLDPNMLDNKMYYQAWKDAYTYCRHYSFRFAWDAHDKNDAKWRDNPLCLLCPNEFTR